MESRTTRHHILVTGYPLLTPCSKIVSIFSIFGKVTVHSWNLQRAVLSYRNMRAAKNAIKNKHLHVNGHLLLVKAYETPASRVAPAPTAPVVNAPNQKFGGPTWKRVNKTTIDPTKIDLSGDFQTQVDRIMEAICLKPKEIEKIATLYTELEDMFQQLWLGCAVLPFGSIKMGLGTITSDADCYMSIPEHFGQDQEKFVNCASRLLSKRPSSFTEITDITQAIVPLVKFYHIPTGIYCDLSFKTTLGVENSRFIRFLLQLDPRILPTVIVIRYWAKVHKLTGAGKITSYAWLLLIIFYLQQPPHSILPSVAWLQRDKANEKIVEFWNTGYSEDINNLPEHSNDSTISELIGGFFEFYSIFNFREMTVCPFLGEAIKTECFKDTCSLPTELDLYKKIVLCGQVRPIHFKKPFCIQDPFDLSHNVISYTTSRAALDIILYIQLAADIYKAEKKNNCTDFLKTLLLETPTSYKFLKCTEYVVTLYLANTNTIMHWKLVVQQLVRTVFEKMIIIQLDKVEEKIITDDQEQLTFIGHVTKPIWKRRIYMTKMVFPHNARTEERQILISKELIRRECELIPNLKIKIVVTFYNDSRRAQIVVQPGDDNSRAFRDFGQFYKTVMEHWFTQLLSTYETVNTKNTTTNIAGPAEKEAKIPQKSYHDNDHQTEVDIRNCPQEQPVAINATSLDDDSDLRVKVNDLHI